MKKPLFTPLLPGVLLASVCQAHERLEELVVVASRREMPLRQVGASVSVIDHEVIELRGYPTMVELLRTQPGVSFSNTGGPGKQSSLSIRGEEGYRTLILIDGVEMSDPTATQVMPQVKHLLASNDLERGEVPRGPQGFIYGADGVFNIISGCAIGWRLKEAVCCKSLSEWATFWTKMTIWGRLQHRRSCPSWGGRYIFG